jgi:glycosyltransferase involved in cell wall biosynthesis
MIHVVIISPYPQNGYIKGGIEGATNTLISIIRNRNKNFKFSVIDIRSENTTSRERIADDLSVFRLPFYKYFQNTRLGYPERIWLKNLVKDLKPSIIHTQGIGLGSYIANQIFENTLITIHGLFKIENALKDFISWRTSLNIKLKSRLASESLKQATCVQHLTQYSKKIYANIGIKNSVIIPNTIDPIFDIFKSKKYPANKIILIVGFISELKNSIIALKKLDYLKTYLTDYKIVFAGAYQSNEFKVKFNDVLQNLKLRNNIEVKEKLTNEELKSLYEKASLFVSFSKQENNPLSILQAFASGVPVLATRVGGIPEMIEDGVNGYLFDSNKHDEFNDKFIRLINSPLERKRFAENSYELYNRIFSNTVVRDSMIDLYQSLL